MIRILKSEHRKGKRQAWLALAAAIMLMVTAPGCGAAWTGSFSIDADHAVVDQAGRRIVVEKPFHRVISLYGAHTENLFALGLDEEIIGVSKNEVYPDEALKKPRYSYRDDAERFLAARPDLVLARPMIDRGYPQLMSRLEKSGITVASLQPGSVDEMFTYWEILGILTGRRERAEEMITRFRRAVSSFGRLTEHLGKEQAGKRVYFEAIHDRMKTFAPEAMAIFALETAGGINAAGDAQSVRGTNIAFYGKERILSRGAEIEVYLAQHGVMNRPTVESIKNEPGFSAIKAVQNDQVFIIDEMIVSRPTLRLLNGIYEIGCVLYPNLFKEAGRRILRESDLK